MNSIDKLSFWWDTSPYRPGKNVVASLQVRKHRLFVHIRGLHSDAQSPKYTNFTFMSFLIFVDSSIDMLTGRIFL